MMHSCQFCQRAFRRKFNRDRHETVSCPKLLAEEEAMTYFSNGEEGLERKAKKCYDREENNFNEDGDEADDDDVDHDDEDEDDGGEETDDGNTESDTKREEVDPWDKMR